MKPLPAPYRDLALVRLAHDRVGPDIVRRYQNDARLPHMLLSTVSIGDDHRESPMIGAAHLTVILRRELVLPVAQRASIPQSGTLMLAFQVAGV